MFCTAKTLLVGLLLTYAATSHGASTLYEAAGGRSSFIPGGDINLSFGWLIKDNRPTFNSATQFSAMPFFINQNASVESIELALSAPASWSNRYRVSILNDAGGLPGDINLWSAQTLGYAPIYSPLTTYPMTKASGSASALDGNTLYWLYVDCIAPCELTWWADAVNAPPGAVQSTIASPHNLRWNVSNDPAAMFRILGTVSPIPEPSPWALMLVGAFMLLMTNKMRVQQPSTKDFSDLKTSS